MKKFNKVFKNFIKDEGGQGMAEYILLLVIVIGVVLMFKSQFKDILNEKIKSVADGMGQVTTQ